MLYVALLLSGCHCFRFGEQGDSYIARFKMFSYGVSECILLQVVSNLVASSIRRMDLHMSQMVVLWCEANNTSVGGVERTARSGPAELRLVRKTWYM